jgi:hypothetical protein
VHFVGDFTCDAVKIYFVLISDDTRLHTGAQEAAH